MNNPPLFGELQCHICGTGTLQVIRQFSGLPRVTSDCQPWQSRGQLAFCCRCRTAQVALTPAWHTEANQIYQQYSIYAQSNGAEQRVFEVGVGNSVARSDRLVECLLADLNLCPRGRLLDIGCGNGAFLRSFHRRMPSWKLMGTESTPKYGEEVLSIDGVEGFFSSTLPKLPKAFQLISMIHVLEHIPEPSLFLQQLHELLADDGVLFVQVPDYRSNPFDLVIADHCTHFSPSSLRRLIASSRYNVLKTTTDWVPKETSLTAIPAPFNRVASDAGMESSEPLKSAVQWLQAVANQARELGRNGGFAVFGTSIAASWIAADHQKDVLFFVDEDPDRIGKKYLERIVHSPHSAPKDQPILLALAPGVAEAIASRLNQLRLQLVLPPKFSFDRGPWDA